VFAGQTAGGLLGITVSDIWDAKAFLDVCRVVITLVLTLALLGIVPL